MDPVYMAQKAVIELNYALTKLRNAPNVDNIIYDYLNHLMNSKIQTILGGYSNLYAPQNIDIYNNNICKMFNKSSIMNDNVCKNYIIGLNHFASAIGPHLENNVENFFDYQSFTAIIQETANFLNKVL